VWQGGFYVAGPGTGSWTLRLEMEGHEHTNRVSINGQTVGYLPSQTWSDMWMSAALPVPAGLLQPGYNELTVEVGPSLPDCQSPGNVWDELLFRRVRLERAGVDPSPLASNLAGSTPVTITVVCDNNAAQLGLQTAWGFACMIQDGERTLLFDTGNDGRLLLANMAQLGFEPGEVDTVVLSHAHADHTGGIAALLQANPGMTVYVLQAFPTDSKARTRAYGAELIEVTEPVEIVPGIWSTGQMGNSPVEQGLILETDSGAVLITGCAHPGIVEMVRLASQVSQREIDLVLGGFHLGGASQAALQTLVTDFRILGVAHVAPCHCTGTPATAALAKAYGEHYTPCGAGLVIQRER
jgi:7,8-dihydropterin-6-yl-methyl-4-(beta-D-ribofuranosyl)aminobenzene 5'-phosphate synthase